MAKYVSGPITVEGVQFNNTVDSIKDGIDFLVFTPEIMDGIETVLNFKS